MAGPLSGLSSRRRNLEARSEAIRHVESGAGLARKFALQPKGFRAK